MRYFVIYIAFFVAAYFVLCAAIAATYVLGALWSRKVTPRKRKERKRK